MKASYEVEVTGVSKVGDACKLELSGKSATIYRNQFYLYLPWDQAKGVAIGDRYVLQPVMTAEAWESPSIRVGHNRIDAGIDAATEAVDRIVPPTPPVPVNAGADMVPLTDEDIPF